jgi:hypothetical protein
MFFFFLTFKLAPFQIHSQLKESIHLSIHMPTGNPAVKEKLHCLVTLDRLTIRVAGGSKDNGGNNDCKGHKQQLTQSSSGRKGGGAAAVATETAMAKEMVTVTATKMAPMPTTGHQQQQQLQRIQEVPRSERLHCYLCLPPSAATAAGAMRKCWQQWGQ